MKSPDNVLLGIAIILLAGVMLYNNLTEKPESEVDFENASAPVTSVYSGINSNRTVESDESVSTAAQTESFTENKENAEPTVLKAGKININTATAEELETLNGIGPAKAGAIIAYREENGPFTSVEELVYVSGIGEKTLQKIMNEITV